jgi:hypothetical protein
MSAAIALLAAAIRSGSFAAAAAGITLEQWLEIGAWLIAIEPNIKKTLAEASPFLSGLLAKLAAGQSPAAVGHSAFDFAQRNQENWDEEVRKFWGGKYPGEY